MIDIVDFQRSLGRARSMMNLHESANTLTYRHAIDKNIPVFYTSKYDLLQWLDRWTPERAERILNNDLKYLSPEEAEIAGQLKQIYTGFARTITTSAERAYSMGAIYETLFDYRYLRQFLKNNDTLLDFGPGCARHALAFGVMQNKGKYIGVDCTEVLYVLQNMIMSFAFPFNTVEYLDYALEGKSFSCDQNVPQGGLLHLPSWEIERISANSVDVLLACHVLDELPRGDFERLLKLIQTSIKSKGIIYSRGTIYNRKKMKMPNYHGYDVLEAFGKLGFKPVINDCYADQGYNVIVWQRQ